MHAIFVGTHGSWQCIRVT